VRRALATALGAATLRPAYESLLADPTGPDAARAWSDVAMLMG